MFRTIFLLPQIGHVPDSGIQSLFGIWYYGTFTHRPSLVSLNLSFNVQKRISEYTIESKVEFFYLADRNL